MNGFRDIVLKKEQLAQLEPSFRIVEEYFKVFVDGTDSVETLALCEENSDFPLAVALKIDIFVSVSDYVRSSILDC